MSHWNSERPKYSLGDIVENTKLGVQVSGTVIGIVNAAHWCRMTGTHHVVNNLWTAEYPEWINKPVYFVWLDIPTNVIPYKHFLGEAEDSPAARFSYNLLPVTQVTSLPEDDITLIRGQIQHDS
jgi:hypothetical protein